MSLSLLMSQLGANEPREKKETVEYKKVDVKSARYEVTKEPEYKGQASWFLAVLGAKAQKSWVVIDDATCYVDWNGNGDLTEAGEDFELKKKPSDSVIYKANVKGKEFSFDITKYDSEYSRKNNSVSVWGRRDSLIQSASLKLSPDRSRAEISHFFGPLTVLLGGMSVKQPGSKYSRYAPFALSKSKDREMQIYLSTKYEGVEISRFFYRGLPKGIKPEVEVEYKDKETEKPFVKKYFIEKRC